MGGSSRSTTGTSSTSVALRSAATSCSSGSRTRTQLRVKPEPADPARHLPESNPWSYVDRVLMVKAAALEVGLDLERVHVIPFPVNEPELWPAYVPDGVTQYLRLFSDWGGEKLDRLRAAGYEVVILDEGAEKDVSGTTVREALRTGGDWEPLVPAGVARVIRGIDRAPTGSPSA